MEAAAGRQSCNPSLEVQEKGGSEAAAEIFKGPSAAADAFGCRAFAVGFDQAAAGFIQAGRAWRLSGSSYFEYSESLRIISK